MNDVAFHETRMGRTVIEKDIPDIVMALQEIATELRLLRQDLQIKKSNDGSPRD